MKISLTKIKRPDHGFDWMHKESGFVISKYAIINNQPIFAVYYQGKAAFFSSFKTARYFICQCFNSPQGKKNFKQKLECMH